MADVQNVVTPPVQSASPVKEGGKHSITPENRLFGRLHLIAAFWALVVGVVGFFGGRFWEKSDPPQPVIVANPEDLRSAPTPTIVTATAELDEASRNELRAAAEAVRALVAEQKRSLDHQESVTASEIRRLQDKVAALQAVTDAATKSLSGTATGTAAAAARAAPMPPGSLSISTIEQNDPPVILVRPIFGDGAGSSFKLPDTAKGYWPRGSPRYLTGLACPKDRVLSTSSSVELTYVVREESFIGRMSPLYLAIARVDAPGRQTEMFARFIPIILGPNNVELATRLESGKYQLTAGYYLLDKLSGEFPVLYGIQCEFSVSP